MMSRVSEIWRRLTLIMKQQPTRGKMMTHKTTRSKESRKMMLW
jgi:hypothetical protein